MSNFPCTSCGACCRRLHLFPKDLIEEHGLKHDQSGRCENLQENNKCRIYEDRPEICIVDHKKYDVDADFYYKVVANSCNTWMEEDKSEYERVKL
tara:strand:+ start:32633 stop:32917 length:285 start_codon:yes stop_codon:yes gene_type:complete